MSGIIIQVISTYPDENEKGELPEKLQRMLSEKRRARREWQLYRAPSLKTKLNYLEGKLKKEIAEYRLAPELWCKRHRQRLPAQPPSKFPHILVQNPSDWAKDEIRGTFFGRVHTLDEICFKPKCEEEYQDVIEHLQHMKEMQPDFEYLVCPRARPPIATNTVARNVTSPAKYPEIVVSTFPNWIVHLENIRLEFGRQVRCGSCGQGIRFIPEDAPEYHFVVRYLKRIKDSEPGLEYFVCPLKVGIRGLPGDLEMEAIKEACAEEGYQVDEVRLIGRVYFVKLFGGEDNTSILNITSLFLLSNIKVELWRGRPEDRG